MNGFRLEDELTICHYWQSKNGYCYEQVYDKLSDTPCRPRRISAQSYINAYERYHNY